MTRIFITRQIPDKGIKMLKKINNLQIEIYEKNKVIPRRELLRRIKGVDILLSLLTDKIDKEVIDSAGPSLKMIANYAVGFDNIDLIEAKKRGIVVTNTPSKIVSEAVAEHAITLIFGLAHRIIESDAYARAGKYHEWNPTLLLGTDVMGKTLGILGCGRIGTALAKRMHDGFGVKIIYHDSKRQDGMEKEFGATFVSKVQLLRQADFVSLHLPLCRSTHHYISTKELKMMKNTAFLINTARGPVVDELALIKALKNNQIAGAGIDVFECEPLIDCRPSDTYELRKCQNVIMTPHTASATDGARQVMSEVAAENIIAFLKNKIPPNAVK